jgi:hypothetical protein
MFTFNEYCRLTRQLKFSMEKLMASKEHENIEKASGSHYRFLFGFVSSLF